MGIRLKASKLGLKKNEVIKETKKIIDNIKILVHLPHDLRETFFEEIKSQNKEILQKNAFLIFLNFLEKNYVAKKSKFGSMLNYNLDEIDIGKELYIRSNNVIEGYNNRYIHNNIKLLINNIIIKIKQ